MSLTWPLISVCLDQHAKIERAWHTRDAEVAKGAPSSSSSVAVTRKDEERDELMAKMATQLELLTKQVMGSGTHKVHVVDTQPDAVSEEAQFQAMYEEEVKFAATAGGGVPTKAISAKVGTKVGTIIIEVLARLKRSGTRIGEIGSMVEIVTFHQMKEPSRMTTNPLRTPK